MLREMIKLPIEYIFNGSTLQKLRPSKKARIVLLLSPQYMNYGDHAIALSELKWLQYRFPDAEVLDINLSLFSMWPERVKSCISADDVLVVTGGGYMGSLWPELQAQVDHILEYFPDNRILFAPQTIFYGDTDSAQAMKRRFASLLKNHEQYLFCARDEMSCRVLSDMGITRDEHYTLIPDFALLLRNVSVKRQKPTNRPLVILRKDKEAKSGQRDTVLKQLAELFPDGIQETDMAKDHVETPTWLREHLVKRKLEQYANADVVITDRLHAMMYAAYVGTPCVALDNVSKKVSGMYQWIRELPYVQLASEPSDVPACVQAVMPYRGQDNAARFRALQEDFEKSYGGIMDDYIRKGLQQQQK